MHIKKNMMCAFVRTLYMYLFTEVFFFCNLGSVGFCVLSMISVDLELKVRTSLFLV